MIDAVASHAHFVDHLAPIWHALPASERGVFATTSTPARRRAIRLGLGAARLRRSSAPLLCATWGDVRRHGSGRRVVYVEHGAGQGYGGEPPAGTSPDPDDGCPVALALVPSETVAHRVRLHHSHAEVVVVGAPRLDGLRLGPPRHPGPPVVAFAWHWDSPLCPETRTAFDHWSSAVAALVRGAGRRWRFIGHGHPRIIGRLRPWYERVGVSVSEDSDAVLAGADVLVADNTSLLYEFAALDRPVVLLDAPWYRRDVDHGMRFWSHADMGPRVGDGSVESLRAAVDVSLVSDPSAARRREVVGEVWGPGASGAALRAADAILTCVV